MANLELSKANKIKVLNSFPSSFVGKEGDLIISKISGKGKYLCAKVGGTWFAADKLNELNRLTTPKMSDLTVNSLKAGRLSILNKPVGGEIDLSAGDLLLDVAGDIILDADGGDLYFKDNGTTLMQLSANEIDIPSGDLTLDVAGDITLDAYGKQINFAYNGITYALYDINADNFTIKNTTNVNDYFNINVGTEGATTLSTVDADTTVGHLTLQPDGDLILDAGSQKVYLPTGDKFYFDGGGDTYIHENSADSLRLFVGDVALLSLTEAGGGTSDKVSIPAETGFYFDGGSNTYIHEQAADVMRLVVGGDTMIQLSEKGDDGNEISFGSSCAGFTQLEPTYNSVLTNVDFRHSNKQHLTFGAGNITNVSMYFPLVSGNFQLLIKQDGTGSRTITNYRVYEFDESLADGENAVKFAGGSNPTLTTDANHVDILSFYWDADNEIAYGVATLDFQF